MKKNLFAPTLVSAVLAATITACGGSDDPVAGYRSKVLVSDGSSPAPNTLPDLRNAWGIALGPGVAWLSANGSQRSVLLDGNGVPQSLIVDIPAGINGAAGPTGIVFNGSATDFVVGADGKSGNAAFLFATEAGTIAGWSPLVRLTQAVTAYDDGAGGAIYKGLAVASDGGRNVLLATDFHNAKVDVFDAAFNKITPTGSFQDASIPPGYAPFGIQAIGSRVYVTYAKQDPTARVQVAGAGLGYVGVFDTAGHLVQQARTGPFLDAPWGIVQAPADFGPLSNDLLVGNFGDGTISAFHPRTLDFAGKLTVDGGGAFAQRGLWGLAFAGAGAAMSRLHSVLGLAQDIRHDWT